MKWDPFGKSYLEISNKDLNTALECVAAVAEAYYIPFAPHNPSGPVANAATLQLAANARNTTGAELVVDGGNTIQLYPIIKK
ncbi:MAG: hypothetical protein IKV36_03375 [Clostridia bacterium]|nr:hypothetical protein [Clostridia bacterium]